MNTKTAARILRKLADGYAKKYADFEDDAKYQKTLVDDANVLRDFAALIEKSDFNGAVRMYYHMDTAVQEEIPDSVMEIVEAGIASTI